MSRTVKKEHKLCVNSNTDNSCRLWAGFWLRSKIIGIKLVSIQSHFKKVSNVNVWWWKFVEWTMIAYGNQLGNKCDDFCHQEWSASRSDENLRDIVSKKT